MNTRTVALAQFGLVGFTRTAGAILLAAVVLTLAAAAPAQEKQKLKKRFQPLYGNFGHKIKTKIKIVSGPEDVKMRNGKVLGKRWMATDGKHEFKLTVENKTEHKLEKLIAVLEKLPAPYMRACSAVSDEGEDGVAIYAKLGGAAAHGGKGYINMIPSANALVVAHEVGHTLEQVAREKDEKILDKWAEAIEADKISVSKYGDRVRHEDLAEFAQVYAVCLDAGSGPLAELKKLSPARFALWEKILEGPERTAKIPSWAKVCKAQIAEANKLGVPVAFTNDIGIRFVLVPAGKFMMGSRDSAEEVTRKCNLPHAQAGWFFDEHPQHEAEIAAAFYLAIHEMTLGTYRQIIEPRKPRNEAEQKKADEEKLKDPSLPMGGVSCEEAQKFCQALSKRDKRKYSAPTEMQWEYACRAGTTTPFCFGETISTARANYNGDYTYGKGKKGGNRGKPTPVGSFPPNAWGLYDMHGNLAEVCETPYAEYSKTADAREPAKDKNSRVVRGGAWRSYPGACRSAFRSSTNKGHKTDHIGFRPVCALP